jgi:hypothetical protein
MIHITIAWHFSPLSIEIVVNILLKRKGENINEKGSYINEKGRT